MSSVEPENGRRTGSPKVPKEGLGFRRNGVESRLGGMTYSFSESSLSFSSESNGHHRGHDLVRHHARSTELPANATSSSLILQSIIQHLCSLYEQDPERRQRLFVSICSSLSKMKVMSPTFHYDEMTALRSHYQHAFAQLIKVAQETLDGNRPLTNSKPPLAGPPSPFLTGEELYHHSRYSTEFEELGFLAKGGFGSVFKVRNRLDDAEYAIKKIILKHRHTDLFVKILREVTTLAQLTHPNIVCYKTAWLEPYLVTTNSRKAERSSDDDDSTSGAVSSNSGSQSNPFLKTNHDFDGCEQQRTQRNKKSVFNEDDNSNDESESEDVFDDDVDDDASWGVVFAADDIDESDGIRGAKTKKKRRSVVSKILVDQKLSPCKIEELDELGTDEEELPRVIGLAATPPQAISFRHRHERRRSRLKMFEKGGDGDCRAKIERKRVNKTESVVGSKFWIGSSSDMSSCSGNPQAKVHKNKTNKKKQQQVSFEPRDVEQQKPTSVVPREGVPGYWSHQLLERQAKKMDLLFKFPNNPDIDELRQKSPISIPNHDKAVLFIQMQLCELTLRAWLDDRNEKIRAQLGSVSYDENVHIFRQILAGVAYIHSKGIVHRDLKPRNIFIDRDNRVQIGDFGLAKKELFNDSTTSIPPSPEAFKAEHPTLQKKPSQHTSGVGTQAYAAPEQLSHGLIDFKSDMYSLGIVLFELFSAFTTTMERSCAISSLRSGAATGDENLIPKDLESKFPVIGSTIRRLTVPDSTTRPSASELLATTFCPHYSNSNNGSTNEVCPRSDDDALVRLEDENRTLKEKIKLNETQLAIQLEVIDQQRAKIEMLEKMISSKLFGIN